ncbi:MAG: oxidoreductase, partial [Nitrososphaeria archaeon]|nr:oxidoreductase [Nitrososphaeria archaeon]
ISKGRFKEALDLMREKLPLPGVLGRVCSQPCESECKRGDVDKPVAIRGLKRFAYDAVADEKLVPLPR